MTKSRNIRHRFKGSISDDDLRIAYLVRKMTIPEISLEYDVSPKLTARTMKKIGIQLRKGQIAKTEMIIGRRYNRLTFIKEESPKSNHRRGLFRCDCGKETIIGIYDVTYGHTSSCGCYRIENQKQSATTHGATRDRNNPPEYRAWKAMKARCYDKNNISYQNYGGRGIVVCEKWLNDYSAFLADVGEKPTPQHTIDRIEVNGNYEPSNVRWATKIEQMRNTRLVHPVTINGVTKLICEWAEISKVPEESISSRLRSGWDVERAVFCPITRPRTNN